MLVEYDVLARDHQDANVSYFFNLLLSMLFFLTEKRGDKAK